MRVKLLFFFSVTRATQWNYSLLYVHTFLLFMFNTNSAPLRTTHASFDTSLSVPRALKNFPLVSSYVQALMVQTKSLLWLFSPVFGGLAILYEVVPKLQGFFTGVGCWTEHPINYVVSLFRNLKRRGLWNIYKGTLYHRKPALYEISGNSDICEHLWEVCTSACKVQANFQQCVRRFPVAQQVCRKP